MFSSDYKKVWKNLTSSKTVQSYHIIQLAILRAMDKYKDDPAIITKSLSYVHHKMAKAFTPVRRRAKLENGRKEFDAVVNALGHIQYGYGHLFFQDAKNILDKKGLETYRDISRHLTMNGFVEYYNREYVYIFVRQDISPEYQAVQSAHVTLKAGWHFRNFDMPEEKMNNLYFTLVGVANTDALHSIVKERKIAIPFYEPDLNNQITAVVLPPVKAKDRGKLLSYKRLVFQPPQRTEVEIWAAQKKIINENAP